MGPELNLRERKHANLRRNLDELGYHQSLGVDSLHLVEALLSDLLHTTESLRHYKELAQKTLEERSFLQGGIEPYKKENAKLVREVNELHTKLINHTEAADKTQKELRKKIFRLESDCSDLQFIASQHLATVKTLEKETAEKTQKILQLQRKGLQTVVSTTAGGKRTSATSNRPTLEIDAPLKPKKTWKEQYSAAVTQAKDPNVINIVDMSYQRIDSLTSELSKLRDSQIEQSEVIDTLKMQLSNRDKEIERLSVLLEGGRSLTALKNDCTCRESEMQISKLTSSLCDLEKTNKELETRLRESVGKQHEAMTRAMRLAERNKQLEKELHDIDHIALAVEEECSSTVRENSERVSKIQERLDASLAQVRDLEREVLELKRNGQEAQADLESAKKDARHATRALDKSREENRRLSERINNLLMIEHDLNVEIDRLNHANANMRQKLTELETRQAPSGMELSSDNSIRNSHISNGRLGAGKHDVVPRKGSLQRIDQPTAKSPKSSSSPDSELLEHVSKQNELIQKLQSERDYYCREYEDLQERFSALQHEINLKTTQQGLLQQLQDERDHFQNEFQKLKEKETSLKSESNNMDSLKVKLHAREKELRSLEKINKELASEKIHLQSRIDALMARKSSITSQTSPPNGVSVQTVVKRLEHERDMARDDIRRLQEERDALRERIKLATETQVAEHARLEKAVIESEERVRRLEAERRELLSGQGDLKGTLLTLQEEADSARSQLRQTQAELMQQQSMYNQIRNLQEQTDRSLSETQAQLTQLRMELNTAQERVRELERDRSSLDREVATLKSERAVLRGSLAQLDQEKDALLVSVDTKTERLAVLEQEIKSKDTKLLNLESSVAELQKKLDISLDETAARDAAVRAAERELATLRSELESTERTRDGLLRENKRLQDDLASLTNDCRIANRELKASQDQTDVLKRQLQDYVAEIRRIEELLARKESERSDMLEQFRGLSLEAEALESNNLSLETESQEQKSKLRLAEDRIAELEQDLGLKDSLVLSYEAQIKELTSQVASLESQVRQQKDVLRKAETDLTMLRDVCVTLDDQKGDLQQQVEDSESQRVKLETEVSKLREKLETMQVQAAKEKATVASLERILDDSRQESLRFRRSSQEAESEVLHLKRKISDLEADLEAETSDLRTFKNQAAEYSRQVAELQRQITDERFERARLLDESRSYSTL